MLHFVDIYLKTKIPCKLRDIHEIEHKIFLIPELAKIYDETNAITNGMSYSRGIRFSIITNKKQKTEKFKNFFLNLKNFYLPEWTKEEKLRFEAEEKEWLIRQRQYFGSFATKCFEEEFDKINNIKSIKIDKNILKFFEEKPNKADFEKIRKILIFEIEKQKIYFDQEANVVMGFSINDEKNMIKNASFEFFINNYDNFFEKLSFVKKEKNPKV